MDVRRSQQATITERKINNDQSWDGGEEYKFIELHENVLANAYIDKISVPIAFSVAKESGRYLYLEIVFHSALDLMD